MRNVFRALVAVLGLASLAASAGFLYRGWSVARPPQETAAPYRATIVRKIVANGSIIPRKEVKIKPQVSGVLEKLLVTPGQSVKAGDLLARVRLVPNPIAVNDAESALEKAKIRRDRTASELQRHRKLGTRGVVSDMDLSVFQLDHDLAQEELRAAQNTLELTLKGETRAAQKASNRVVATVDGMVLDRPVEEGDYVIETNTFNEGTTILTLADMGQLLFRGLVDEADAGRLAVGTELEIRIGALEDRVFRAKLEYIAPKGIGPNADKSKRKYQGTLEDVAPKAVVEAGVTKFEIRAGLQLQPGVFVRAGYSAVAEAVLGRREGVLAVDEKQLLYQDGRAFVLVEEAPRDFRPREVALGLSDGLVVEVVGGLSGGERLLAHPEGMSAGARPGG